MEMKTQLEIELNDAFCNKSMVTGGVSENCHTKVSAFTEGSINVLFQINEIVEMSSNSMPTDSHILTNMQQTMLSGGIGNYAINDSSVIISKFIIFRNFWCCNEICILLILSRKLFC